jgi:hypothetical protein
VDRVDEPLASLGGGPSDGFRLPGEMIRACSPPAVRSPGFDMLVQEFFSAPLALGRGNLRFTLRTSTLFVNDEPRRNRGVRPGLASWFCPGFRRVVSTSCAPRHLTFTNSCSRCVCTRLRNGACRHALSSPQRAQAESNETVGRVGASTAPSTQVWGRARRQPRVGPPKSSPSACLVVELAGKWARIAQYAIPPT